MNDNICLCGIPKKYPDPILVYAMKQYHIKKYNIEKRGIVPDLSLRNKMIRKFIIVSIFISKIRLSIRRKRLHTISTSYGFISSDPALVQPEGYCNMSIRRICNGCNKHIMDFAYDIIEDRYRDYGKIKQIVVPNSGKIRNTPGLQFLKEYGFELS